ncbi:uncharacterized protein Hap1MRO34_018473 isoform 2-T2 [Clarias gariepinus]|uniref:uncharacterized protein LOC128544471 n=1 Tax=Clarias gariepinus TaxID=13013 RepID=UPI00234D03C1|nr:uncharacterized protein LOC128544471 [Clarias gariepinus]
MKVIVGILLMFMGAASGLLFQDPVVCRFTQSNQCYVALGQQLNLQMPRVDMFQLKITDKTSTDHIILKYRPHRGIPLTVYIKRWQFVNNNKTLILTSAQRSDNGTYTLQTFDAKGNNKGIYTLQLNIEAEVTSVKVSYSCLSPAVWRVYCSADGDNLFFNWSSGFVTWFENGSSTLVLDKIHKENVTCHVQNHVSHDSDFVRLHKCPDLRNKMQDIIGILLMFMGAASGLLIQDPVVCRFTESNQCYAALGQKLNLQMPRVAGFNLTITDGTSTKHIVYRHWIPQTPHNKRWQFVYDNKTLILTSVERSDNGTYTLQTFDVNGKSTGSYTLQVNIEGYPEHKPLILGLVCVLLIVISVLGYFTYKKKQGLKNKEVQVQNDAVENAMVVTPPSQEKKEGDVQYVQAQDDAVEHAMVVTPPSQRKKKKKKKKMKKECDVQYGELVFNTPDKKEKEMPKVQEESVYSQIQHG